jgi:hypothetical protein
MPKTLFEPSESCSFVEMVQRWDGFFFNYSVSIDYVALLRVLTAFVVLVSFWKQRKDILFFGQWEGAFGFKAWKTAEKTFPQFSLFHWLPPRFCSIRWMMAGTAVTGGAVMLGVATNVSLWLFFVFVASIQSRVYPILFTGGDSVVRFLLVCLALCESRNAFTVDHVLFGVEAPPFVAGWPIRLIQIYVCSIYMNSAIYKGCQACWINGHAVRDSIRSGLWGRGFTYRILDNSTLSVWTSRVVVVYEFLAPLTLWFPETSFVTVVIGLLFHAGLGFHLQVGYFASVMMVALLSFLVPAIG